MTDEILLITSATIFAIIIILIISACINSSKRNSVKILGVYTQPGRWFYLKYLTFLILVLVRRLKSKIKPIPEQEYESVRSLSKDPKAFDAVFLHSVTQNGFYCCGGIERRNNAKVNGLFYLVVPGLGLLESLKLPKTMLDADPDAVKTSKKFGADGLTLTPVEPMKSWKITFNAPMKFHEDPSKIVKVKFDAKWTSDLPYFLFERDMNAKCLSQAMAREIWSKDFFEALKQSHQTHYEQMGRIEATLQVGTNEYSLEMEAFRDHSFGHKRDWSLMHRYIFHMFYLEDGSRVSIGVVSQPCTTSHLEMGYVVRSDKTISSIEKCDLKLYQHAENCHELPKDYAFVFETNTNLYQAQIQVEYEATHYKGDDIEAKLIERFITCEVNGIKGRGISEWHYNNKNK